MKIDTKESRMNHITHWTRTARHAGLQTLLCAALASAAWSAHAADEPAAPAAAPAAADAGAAPQAPAPNPAAEKALAQRFQAMFNAFEGKAALPDSKSFTEDFNKQVTGEQMKQVLQQVHQSVGACRIGGVMQSPSPYVTSYILQCDKAFVPMDISIEEKAPYRLQSLMIRPPYLKK